MAVMAEPLACPGRCVFCPTYLEAPKSYTPDSPAVIRARHCGFDPGQQVEQRIKTLTSMGHPTNKIELIVMGGTFLAYPEDYQYKFIKACYDALNRQESSSLEEAKTLNETSEQRCVGLCIETRPDWCDESQIKHMLDFGTTRVEIGVQTIDDDIYKLVKRGHTVADVIKATRLLKEYGLKVHYHIMPGLPGSNPVHDIELARRLFEDQSFKPDGLKLYPTLVVAGTELEQWYNNDKYQPYSAEDLVKIMISIKSSVPGYVRISRVMRDIPTKFIVAGCKDLALRGSLKKRMEELNVKCHCIRCREYGHRAKDGWKLGEPNLKRIDYQASGGHEVFLTCEDENETIFGLLRLRINMDPNSRGHFATVREIHVYGHEVPVGIQGEAIQHRGIGNRLFREAERIARDEFKANTLAVISGVGARDYFRNEFGYRLENAYMVGNLS